MKGRLLLLFVCFHVLVSCVFPQSFLVVKNLEGIKISEHGKPILFYQVKSKTVGSLYKRAGYVHPLFSLGGDTLTEDAPSDHPYHRGIFWAWHQIVLNGKKVADGWMSDNVSFNVTKTKTFTGHKHATIYSELVWRLKQDSVKARNIVKEHVLIKVYKKEDGYRYIDFDIQIAALVSGITLGGSEDVKGYGGFCLRLNLPDDIKFYSKEGEVWAQETAVAAAPWMDFTGSFGSKENKKNGVAVFCKPAEGDAGNNWILRKTKSMQNAVYPGNTPLLLTKKGWRLQYRLLIHDKEMDNNLLEKLYKDYVNNIIN